MTRVVIGNLDAESEWSERPDDASRPSVEAASGAATLLRVFARDGDVLWTPAAVDARRIPSVPGLASPRFVTGPLPPAPTARLAWAETDSLPAWSAPASGGTHWIDRLWSIPPPPAAVARAVNDRGFDLDLALAIGVPIPGSKMATTRDSLLDAVRNVGGPWIAKSTWSAAGRHRVRGEIADIGDPAVVATLTALLARGPVRVEAWVPREVDVGAVGLAHGDGRVELVGSHAMVVDGRGRFRGAETEEACPDEVRDAFEKTGEALARAGYRGPFGIDGFRTADGRWFPLGEINGRLTFGFVLHGLALRLGMSDARLIFSKSAPPRGAVTLLRGGAESPIGAWVEPRTQI